MDYNVIDRIDTSLKLNSINYQQFFDHMKQESQGIKDGIQMKTMRNKEEVDALVEELKRANVEKQRLTEMLALVNRKHNVLREYVTKTDETKNKNNNGSMKMTSYQNNITNHFNNGNNNNNNEVKYSNKKKVDSEGLQQFLVDQMASSVTRDPTFREAIAKAMSSAKLLHQPS